MYFRKKTYTHLLFFATSILLINCRQQVESQVKNSFSGVSISNTGRHGRPKFGNDSSWHAYFNITTTITNDTTVPIQLDLQFETEYKHLNKTFRLFLLPQNMDVEAQKKQEYFSDTVVPFMKLHEHYPTTIKKVLQPGEKYLVNVSYLSPKNSDFGPGQLAIISNQHPYNFASIPDNIVKLLMKDEENSNLYLGLNFSTLTDSMYGFKLVPMGKIKYTE